jgi:hypothetical protein
VDRLAHHSDGVCQGTLVGGFQDLEKLAASGELKKLLA